jgi:hypothetical protein
MADWIGSPLIRSVPRHLRGGGDNRYLSGIAFSWLAEGLWGSLVILVASGVIDSGSNPGSPILRTSSKYVVVLDQKDSVFSSSSFFFIVWAIASGPRRGPRAEGRSPQETDGTFKGDAQQ